MGCYKKNEALQVNYIALHKTAGLTDVYMKVYNPSDTLVTTVTMTEVVAASGENVLGLYRGSFTPTTDGQWRVRIESVTNNDDISKIFEVGNYKLDDVKDQTQSIEDKTDIIDGNVDLIKTETDKIQTIDDNVDLIKTETDKIQTIDDNLDSVKTTVETTDGKVDIIDGNVDSIKTETDKIQSIKETVEAIDTDIAPGGYILN